MPYPRSRNPSLDRVLRLGLSRTMLGVSCALSLAGCTSVDAQRRVEVTFESVSEIAFELSQEAYREPRPQPEALKQLSYDDYFKIGFKHDSYLWRSEGLPFGLGFFHPGFLHSDRVKIREFTPTHEQNVPFSSSFFHYGDPAVEESLPSGLDFTGFRLSSSVGNEGEYREVASFLGASYFRGTGYDQTYGTSARGVAIDSGMASAEEFPRFTEFWLGKPLANSRDLRMFALLEGPSVTGAFEFVIRPGPETTMDVRARFFMREEVESFGVAPLTSMFWRGENRPAFEIDYRPEVHDSDGLVVLERGSMPVWRALDLDDQTRLSYFQVSQFEGFGLMQRDRDFESYQDMEALYHRRASVWVEAKGDWGPGFVKLIELPTRDEFQDNIVAYWEPAVLPEKGASLEFEYTLHWSSVAAPRDYPPARVVATRIGESHSYPGTHILVVDFAGGPDGVGEPSLVAAMEGPSAIVDKQVVWNPYARTWRATLRVNSVKPTDLPVEMRCQLMFEDGSSSEIWAYQWTLADL